MEAGKLMRAQWDGIEGYELAAGSRPTQESIKRAKAEINPDLWAGMQEAKSLVESLKRQIDRLGGSDYDAASRAYTLMSGG
jgi:hypothetical protein